MTPKAQLSPKETAGLSIGDLVPAALSGTTITAGKPGTSRIKLSDYRGKLLLLDFWATWCTACIHNFPETEQLRKEFDGQLDVLLVNASDPPEKIRSFFVAGLKNGNKYPFPTVVSDLAITAAFPHQLLPHYVWIAPDGKVLAITGSDQLTSENVRKLLGSSGSQLELKADIDREKPLLLADHPAVKQLQQYSILLKGRITGLPSGNVFRREGDVVRGRMMSNVTLLTLFQVALRGSYPDWDSKRFRIEVSDSSRLFAESSSLSADAWNRENLYNYDLIVPPGQADSLYSYMLADLNRYTPYTAHTETRRVHRLSLCVTGDTSLFASKGGLASTTLYKKTGRQISNQPVAYLLGWLNNRIPNLEVNDLTGYTGRIDLRLPDTVPETLEGLRAALQTCGLGLRDEIQNKTCFILSDKKLTTP